MTATPFVKPPVRSMGLKLLLVCLLALLMSIPALFVFAILSDRTNRAQEVVQEVSNSIGGRQTFIGPILSVPYTRLIPAKGETKASLEQGSYIIFPQTAKAQAKTETSVRQRGLFKAPVWTGDLTLHSSFDLTDAGSQAGPNTTLDWTRAEFLVGATDARGALANVVLTTGGQSSAMEPSRSLPASTLEGGDLERNPRGMAMPTNGMVKFFGLPAKVEPGAKFDASSKLKFRGAQRLAVVAYGKTTDYAISGDWSSPSYDGGRLPEGHTGLETDKTPSAKGFSASWSFPYVARGVPSEGEASILGSLGATAMGVSFVEQANPYQAVQRSLKYSLMFVGLVFLAYFLFETTQKKRVHPAQYVLIGLAQVIFYLLLLSIAERIGFDGGFAIAAGATVALISAYAGWVFESRKQGFIALAAFSGLYLLIYVLMRLEDWALLVGAVASFAAIAAVMYFTRRIDWYGVAADDSAAGPPLPTPDKKGL